MTLPAPDRTFTFAALDWDPEPSRFLTHASELMERAKTHVDLSGEDTPDYAYYTALPKVPFTSSI